jgi:hypothetical protein
LNLDQRPGTNIRNALLKLLEKIKKLFYGQNN